MKKSHLWTALFTTILSALILISFTIKDAGQFDVSAIAYSPSSRCGSMSQFQFDLFPTMGIPLAPKLDGLGSWEFEITTTSNEAQEFFNQGLRLVYAFNHAEAHRAFLEAARLDENCAMAYWGQALCLGPNINDGVLDNQRQKSAYSAIQSALEKMENASEIEQNLIQAFAVRHTDKEEPDQASLNQQYFEAMENLYHKYPDHPEIGTLYAAAFMNTTPWDYYDENLELRENTAEAIAALEKVAETNPEHPGVHHYYIHIKEEKDPLKAVPNADALGLLMPKAGHIVHMPSHIYIRVGMYEKAAESNRQAIKADEEYLADCLSEGLYPIAYYPHNVHFLWASSTMLGNSKEAIFNAKKTAEKAQVDMAPDFAFIQDFMTVPVQAYIRFGKWNAILTTPKPASDLLHANMMWRYGRGIALCRKGNLDQAISEMEQLQIIVDTLVQRAEDSEDFPSSKIGQIALSSLKAEIHYDEGDVDSALASMKQAVAYEDALPYYEPEAWHTPTRHYYGAMLLESGKAQEAELVYRFDLDDHPHNGWALFGLHQSLVAQEKWDAAKEIQILFEQAWSNADVTLTSSRF